MRSYAVVPRDEYGALREGVDEDKTDIAVARRVLKDADKEFVPFEFAECIAIEAHPILVWRDYQGIIAGTLQLETVSPSPFCQISRSERNLVRLNL